MRPGIIHHHDLAGFQHGAEKVLQEIDKDRSIESALKTQRRLYAVGGQSAKGTNPLPPRGRPLAIDPLAAHRAAILQAQVQRGAHLIKKDQLLGGYLSEVFSIPRSKVLDAVAGAVRIVMRFFFLVIFSRRKVRSMADLLTLTPQWRS